MKNNLFIRKFKWVLIFASLSSNTLAAEYVIQKDDTLSEILVSHGYDGSKQALYYEVRKIARAHPLVFDNGNPNTMVVGATIVIPGYQSVKIVIGTLSIKQGQAKIVRESKTHIAKPKESLFSRDTILTQAKSTVKLEMVDGAVFELGPNTVFNIDNYRYRRDDENILEKASKAIFSLLQGVARAVTGVIGNSNKNEFVFNTPVATIGIRGTDYTVRYCQGEACGKLVGTSVAVVDGGVELKNDSGVVSLAKGEFARAETVDSAPKAGPMPAGFLDIDKEASEVSADWWRKVLNLFN